MEHYGFFNGGTEYGQEEFNRYFDNIYESGIAVNSDQSLQYPLSISSGKVRVGIGFSIIRGFFHYNDSVKELTLAAGYESSKNLQDHSAVKHCNSISFPGNESRIRSE